MASDAYYASAMILVGLLHVLILGAKYNDPEDARYFVQRNI